MNQINEMDLKDVIEQLNNGKLTSVHLVTHYLNRIKLIDSDFNSVSQISINAIRLAEKLDIERASGHIRSHMHGIPILIKDNILTNDDMKTTANSLSLADLTSEKDAAVVQRLRENGLIILGKTNLSEFAYFMSYDNMPSGYGSLNGQVVHPYDKSIDPEGSSTGSAVSVALDLIHVSIGTETNGSLMAPAKKTGIVAIKPTKGLIDGEGIIPISKRQDTAGPMGKTVLSCAYLLSQMTKGKNNYENDINKAIQGRRIGFINYEQLPYNDSEKAIIESAKAIYKSLGAVIVDVNFKLKNLENHITLEYEFKKDLNDFFKLPYINTKMTSLDDIIAFNIFDKDIRMKYGQSILTSAASRSGLTSRQYKMKYNKQLKNIKAYDLLFKTHEVDCMVSLFRTSYAPMGGYPSITVPAKAMNDLEPQSLIFVGKHFDEKTLINIAHHYQVKTNFQYQHKMK